MKLQPRITQMLVPTQSTCSSQARQALFLGSVGICLPVWALGSHTPLSFQTPQLLLPDAIPTVTPGGLKRLFNVYLVHCQGDRIITYIYCIAKKIK